MACPYFIPADPHAGELWPHRSRLPLGDGFAGSCGACETAVLCDDEALRLHCNLGYAKCAQLPADRQFDAVRFLVQSENSALLRVQFAGEREHQPVLFGELRYDLLSRVWLEAPDPRLERLAEAAVKAWIRKGAKGEAH